MNFNSCYSGVRMVFILDLNAAYFYSQAQICSIYQLNVSWLSTFAYSQHIMAVYFIHSRFF